MNRRGFLGVTGGLALSGGVPVPNYVDRAIEKAHEAGLAALKPTARELEHGLQLHGRSLVWDIYGFSPRSSLDPAVMRAMIEEGASEAEIEDAREEMSMTRCADDPIEQAGYKAAWEASGVTCIFQNAGEEGQDPLRLMKRLARFTYVTDMLRGFVSKAAVPDDIEAAKRENRRCLYLTGNGVPLPQRWVSVEEELGYVRLFFQLGIRMMHVTYNRRNMLGDGCGEPSNAGLSDLGRAAISEMNRVGIVVDVAHSGGRTSLEAARTSTSPMVASHTGCAALRDHIRCKSDETIRAIVDTGGLIGICCIPSFLGGGLRAFLDHIDHVVKKFGVDHVAIGTDVAYSAPSRPGPMPSSGRRSRTRFEALWPKGALETKPAESLELSWTNWPLFTVGLVQRGYKDEDIEKILGRNMLRVTRAVLSSRKSKA